VNAASGVAVEFGLGARDFLLVYFFTTTGINANLDQALSGLPGNATAGKNSGLRILNMLIPHLPRGVGHRGQRYG
jgi:hypothetical protein